jgi:transcriptional regulator with GAF, ATPase, and Fis domain
VLGRTLPGSPIVSPEECAPAPVEISNPTLEHKVRQEILAACQRANWKLGGPRGAAARLGLKRATLFYKMKRLGITPPADHWLDASTVTAAGGEIQRSGRNSGHAEVV